MGDLCKRAMAARALQARTVKAHGAFHTPMMRSAVGKFTEAVQQALPKMKPPRCSLYFCSTAARVKPGANPSDFIQNILDTLEKPVEFEQMIKQMIVDQVREFYEVGPLKQIKSMIKRIDSEAF